MTDAASDLDTARNALRETWDLIRAAEASHILAMDALSQGLNRIVERGLEAPLQGPVYGDVAPTDHRRDHRPGVPSKLDTDPELRAFVLARIDRLSFEVIAAEIAKAFPPHRRLAKSALHQWWQRNLKSDQTPIPIRNSQIKSELFRVQTL